MYFYFFPPIFLFNFTPPVLLPSIFQFIQQFVQSVSSIHMKLQKELVSEKMSIPFLSLSRKSIKINCRSIKTCFNPGDTGQHHQKYTREV